MHLGGVDVSSILFAGKSHDILEKKIFEISPASKAMFPVIVCWYK